jgi:excisionase family DNA binding protein
MTSSFCIFRTICEKFEAHFHGPTHNARAPIALAHSRILVRAHVSMPDSRRSYSTLQLAEALGVSVQTVQRWVDAGHIKAWKTVGGHRKIDAESADQWIRRLQAGNAPVDEPAPAEATPSAGWRVLLVDDDRGFLDVLETLVGDEWPDARIEKAHNGFQALQSMARATVDVLVTDILMPHMNGLEMLRHVAKQPNRPALMVVTSVLTREEAEREGRLPRGTSFLRKPLDQDAFAALLRRFAQRAREG